MTIETKYNIGDEVWWFWLGSCVPARAIIVAFWNKNDILFAKVVSRGIPCNIEVRRLFPTKEELLKSL
jgi:hypothetical protein